MLCIGHTDLHSVTNSLRLIMFKMWSKSVAALALTLVLNLAIASQSLAQGFLDDGLFFTTDPGLFERVNGQSVQIPTAPTTALFPNLSRDGRFLTYSRPDLASNNGLFPSSDLVLLDRLTGQQSVFINNDTLNAGGDIDPLSSQVSPNGQYVAFGIRIGPAAGQGNPAVDLKIADFNTGLEISSPFGNTFLDDTLGAGFRGISFLPASDSFVTPAPFVINFQGLPVNSSAIFRFDRNNSGQWVAAQPLSMPTAQQGMGINTSSTYHVYPAISPSGAGLAYFDVFQPTQFGQQASTSRVILANSDGSNPQLLTTFNPGFLPTGLTWAPDGSALVVSVSQQANLGTGFLNIPLTSNSAIFTVSTANGTTSFISNLTNGFSPTLPSEAGPIAPEPLTVRGTQQADVILVTQINDQVLVTVNGVSLGMTDLQDITRVEVFGFGGGDRIEIDAAVPTFISGGFGADEIFGGSLANEIQGGPGPDTIFGGPQADDINAGRGQDTVNGRGGADTIVGGDAADILFGSGGNDTIMGGLGADMVFGGPGADMLFGNAGADKLSGAGGNDFLSGQGGPDEILGGQGADQLTGGEGFDILNGGPSNDTALDQGEVETSIEN